MRSTPSSPTIPASTGAATARSPARLIGNRLFVQRLNPQVSRNGVFLPESARDDQNIGGPKEYLVLGVGPGLLKKGRRIPIDVACGDRVICHSYFTGAIEIPDCPGLFIITADQVIAKIPRQ